MLRAVSDGPESHDWKDLPQSPRSVRGSVLCIRLVVPFFVLCKMCWISSLELLFRKPPAGHLPHLCRGLTFLTSQGYDLALPLPPN